VIALATVFVAIVIALLWPRALPLEHAAADQDHAFAHGPPSPHTSSADACDGRRAESDPSCVHASGLEHHATESR
jgi:hypothetical protein